MAKNVPPVDAEALRQLLSGELPPAEVDRLAATYADDGRLADVARTIDEDDTLAEALRQHAPADPADDQLADRLVARLQAVMARRDETAVPPADGPPPDPDATTGIDAGDDGRPPLPAALEYYRIEKVLGEGGMGTVYLAEDTRLSRKVAIKTLKRELAVRPTAKDRFFREAKAAAKLEHDHIIPIYYVGEAAGTPFLAMPFLKGCPLDKHLKQLKKLPPLADALRIGREVALGLAAAHEAGLIHRDIKPANVWLEAPHGRVKILDFGLARTQSDEANLTASGAVVGTPAYMAPEQARGKPVDARADLFSLGVVLYEMTTGRKPFTGPDMMSVLTSLALDDPPPANAVNPAVPRPVADLIGRLMAKDPGRRPMTAAGVADELLGLTMQTTRPTFEELPPMPTVAPASAAPAPAAADPWGGIDDTELSAVVAPKSHAKPAAAKRGNKWLLPAASLLGLALVTAAVVVIIRDKDGKKIAEVTVPEDGKVEIVEGPKPKADPVKPGGLKPPAEVALFDFSPFDRLDPATIPAGQQPVWLPKETVALFGTRAGKHGGPVTALDATPDGKLAVSVAQDNTLKLFDAVAGEELTDFYIGNGSSCVRLSADGRTLAVVYSIGYADLFAVVDKKLVRRVGLASGTKGSTLNALALSADGRRAAVATSDGKGQVWEMADKAVLLAETAGAHAGPAQGVVFLTGTALFATSGDDHMIRVWETATGKLRHQLGPVAGGAKHLHAARDGKDLICVGETGDVHRWAVDGPGDPKDKSVKLPLKGQPLSTAVDAAGATLAVALAHTEFAVEVWPLDGRATKPAWAATNILGPPPVWLAGDGKRVLYGMPAAHTVGVGGAGGGRTIIAGAWHMTPFAATAAGDLLAGVLDGRGAPACVRAAVTPDGRLGLPEPTADILTEYAAWRRQPAVSAAGRRMYAVVGYGSTYVEHDLSGANAAGQTRFKSGSGLRSPAVSADESTHALAAEDGTWVILKRGAGPLFTEYARIPVSPLGSPRARLAADGRAVYIPDAADHSTFRLRVFDLTGPKPAERKGPAEWDKASAFDVSADGRLAAVYGDRVLTTWDLTGLAPKLLHRKPFFRDDPLMELLLSPDGRRLLLGVEAPGLPGGCHCAVFDTRDISPGLAFDVPLPITRVLFTPEGRHLIVARADGTAVIVRVAKPEALATDRQLAERVIALGGGVGLDGSRQFITAADKLPKGPFKLTHIHLSGRTGVTDADLAPLKDCRHLQSLDLWATKVTDAGLDLFKDMKGVTDLHLESTGITDAGLAKLREFTDLEVLGLERTPVTDAGLETLRAFPRLKNLFVSGCPNLTDAAAARLKTFSALEQLSLNNTNLTAAALADIAGMRQLAGLALTGVPMTDADLAKLVAKLDKLTLLAVDKTQVTAKGIGDAAKTLPDCRIVWDGGVIEPTAADDRPAAEWALAAGAMVQIAGAGDVMKAADLPKTPVKVVFLSLPPKSPKITDQALAAVKNLRHLTSLHMESVPVGDAGLAHFGQCRQLTGLFIPFTAITDAGLKALDRCNFKKVNLEGTKVTGAGLDAFKNSSDLETLNLVGLAVTDDDLARLTKCERLTQLYLRRTKVTAAGAAKFGAARPECRVEYDGGVVMPSDGSIDRAAAQYVLSVGGSVRLNDAGPDVKDAGQLPAGSFRLTRASLAKCATLTDAGLAVFRGCKNLKILNLSDTGVTDAGLAHFADCTELEVLTLSANKYTDAGLAHFANCRKIRELNLHNPAVTDAGLAHFNNCRDLTDLYLYATRVTDAGMAGMTECKALAKLNLSGAKVTDATLARVPAFTALKTINLVNTAVTDAGAARLAECRQLTLIVLDKTKVTAAGMAKLQAALPDCRIGWDGKKLNPPKDE